MPGLDITPLVASGRQLIQGYGEGRFRVAGQVFSGSVLVDQHTRRATTPGAAGASPAYRSRGDTPPCPPGGLARPPFGSRFPLPRGVGNACRWASIARASPPAEETGNAIV